MANTVMTAKNTWRDGLIMDFAPDNTQATCLTSALNATLLTFNGNEMSLQNDMGNGRVETAFLPEGYIPVGTYEFGDIIYIVSYNPITDKSLIGCFPSPERNISSEEVGGLNQFLTTSEFQELNEDGLPTGKLFNSSVKKIIFEKGLNPGDKYVVYSSKDLNGESDSITDYGNISHEYGTWPKMVKLHVVAIEDSGKINYLDSSVKWYSTNDYFIQANQVANNELKPDIDTYRSLVSSAYSIFQSKVSGKLAILAELEKITGFSCTHNVYVSDTVDENGLSNKQFHVYLNSSWTSDNPDINPSGFVVTESKWKEGNDTYFVTTKDEKGEAVPTQVTAVLPIEPNTTEIKEVYEFTSDYDLSNPDEYTTYITTSCYKSLVEAFENLYKHTQGYKNYKDINYLPRKASLQLENNLPNLGKYYINGFGYDSVEGPYFNNLKGVRIYLNALKDDKNLYVGKLLKDTFVHNYFSKDITKLLYNNFTIPSKTIINNKEYVTNLNNLTHIYTVCPAMPYGYLEEFAVTNSINFELVGKEYINLNEWRYYNDGEVSTLTFGLDAYTPNNTGVSKVTIEFIDNNGYAAMLKLEGKSSYSGTFTEVFALSSTTNKNLSPCVDDLGKEIPHKGIGPYVLPDDATLEDIDNMNELVEEGIYIAETLLEDNIQYIGYYENDAGILFPNVVYLAKITVYLQNINSFGEFDNSNTKKDVFYRWFWTNDLFNEYYYNTTDFIDKEINLNIKLQAAFLEIENTFVTVDSIENHSSLEDNYSGTPEILYKSLGYKYYKIDTTNKGANLKLAILPDVAEKHNTFTLNDNVYNKLTYNIYEGCDYIQVPENPGQVSSENSTYIKHLNVLNPIVDSLQKDESTISSGLGFVTLPRPTEESEGWETWANSLKDWFSLSLVNKTSIDNTTIEYFDINGNIKEITTNGYLSISAKNALGEIEDGKLKSGGIDLCLLGEFYSKIMANSYTPTNINCITYKPFIGSTEDLETYNIGYSENLDNKYNHFFNKMYNIALGGKDGATGVCYNITSTTAKDMNKASEDYDELPLSLGKGKKNDIAISNALESMLIDVGIISLLATMPEKEDESGGLVRINTSAKKDKEINDWLNTWGKYKNLGTSDVLYIGTYDLQSNNTAGFTYQLVIKNKQGNYVPFNAFCRCDKNGTGKATLLFKTTSGKELDILGSNYKTMADIFCTILAQLYYRSSESETTPATIVLDIVINNPYSEVWNKEFIVNILFESEGDDSLEFNKLFNMSGLNFYNYINQVKGQIKELIELDDSNVTISETCVENQSNLILFNHTLTYDIAEINSLYNQTNFGTPIYMCKDITGQYGNQVLNDDFAQEILRLDVDSNSLTSDFSKCNSLYGDKDGYHWETNNSNLLLECFTNIQKMACVKDNKFYISKGTPNTNLYKVNPSVGDAGGGTGWDECLWLGFNSNITLSSMFSV